jgi:hydroxypyruvate reductase
MNEGGHPLPTSASLVAAQSAFDLLKRANEHRGLVIFLVSGGGSAMIEWPRDEHIKLTELQKANRVLIGCGASIVEINAVRRSFSAVKGGGLAACAPNSPQVTLVISDTTVGQDAAVASGPSYDQPHDGPSAVDVVARYSLTNELPISIINMVNQADVKSSPLTRDRLRDHYVLLDCGTAIEAATDEARRRGFAATFTNDISEQPIAEGCDLMLRRLLELGSGDDSANRIICLISGGEFSCPVQDNGIGGRNAETALRCALKIDELRRRHGAADWLKRITVLSAGTDGIDGNSPAAGAVANEDTIERSVVMGLDPLEFLERSDAFSLFDALGDTIVTGPTGTNVRDLRITLLKRANLFTL